MLTYYNLRSIIAANKEDAFTLQTESSSFQVAPARSEPYIQPRFSKELFETEKPPIILISAVGATGKTTLAEVLSHQTGLPLLNLSKLKPVGENTLTGLLTTAYRVADLSNVLAGIGQGTYGLIIDGLDEGRLVTTAKGFEAFLDDIIRRCGAAASTSVVLLGRTQIIAECWEYFTDKGIDAGLITIAPFDVEGAREYIDTFTGGPVSAHPAEYQEVREDILDLLGSAFVDGEGGAASPAQEFLSFIGYPPVLDAIVTLLKGNANYHRIRQHIHGGGSNEVEIDLLHQIASFILSREKEQKVLPQFVKSLLEGLPAPMRDSAERRVFEAEEQSIRLVAYCLKRPITLDILPERALNEKYEEGLTSWLREHPFLVNGQFRNAVFESAVLATLIASSAPHALDLALEYVSRHKHHYHLIYFLGRCVGNGTVPIVALDALVGSAQEFRSTSTSVEIHVEGPNAEDVWFRLGHMNEVEIGIEVIIMGKEKEQLRTFDFRSQLAGTESVRLRGRLCSTYVSLPCEVVLYGEQDMEITAPVEICAERIALRSPALVLRHARSGDVEKHVLLEARTVESGLTSIVTNGVDFSVSVVSREGMGYPCVLHVMQKQEAISDPALKEKYLRLKRILEHFRSHSRDSMARFQPKIENERVAGSAVGQAVLKQLLQDQILYLQGNFYFLRPQKIDEFLGVTWVDLRKGRTSPKLLHYLREISVST
jgi:hypothetical protein